MFQQSKYIQMADRIIHPLGSKKQSTQRGLSNTQSSFNKNGSKTLPMIKQPFTIPIKYVYIHHPQINILFNQLVILRKKYDELASRFSSQNPSELQQKQIKEVIQSSHQIQQKMSRIIQQTKQISSETKENVPLTNRKAHEQECLNIIQTVNRATQKIEEMERKNIELQKELTHQKTWKQDIQKQNQRLKRIAQETQNQKDRAIQSLRKQLQMAKIQKQEMQKKKNELYLNESPKKSQALMLSRFEMDGLSRISQIYE